jgi:hypothetical protein
VGAHNPKTDVVVSIVRVVPVAEGGAQVVFIVVVAPAAQHANASACARITTARLLVLPFCPGYNTAKSPDLAIRREHLLLNFVRQALQFFDQS